MKLNTFLPFADLLTDYAVTGYRILVGRKFLKPHRTAGVKFIGRNSDLRAHAELGAVGEAGRNVVIDARRIDIAQKFRRARLIERNDRIAVAGRIRVDEIDRRAIIRDRPRSRGA